MFLNFITWDPDPDIFVIPGIDWPVRWYGLLWALALLASHFVMNRIYRTEGRTNKQLDTLTLYVILGTIIGARLGHCLFYGPLWDVFGVNGEVLEEGYLSHPLNLLKIYEGGLASHGGAIGIILGTLLYCKKEKENVLWIFDRLVVVVPLASMLIRFGNLMNGEIVGTTTNLPWGFIFKSNDLDRFNNIKYGVEFPARHPAQLYEAIFYFGLFLVMYWLWKNKRETLGAGFMLGLLCALMFLQRFFIEYIKMNQVEFEDGLSLNMGQILSIPFILFGIYMMWRAKRKMPVA